MAARGTTVAVVVFASMFLVCFANSPSMKEKVEKMKAQLREKMKFFESEKAKFETERKAILQVQHCNMAKLDYLRKLPTVTAAELKAIETQTLTASAHVQKSFRDMDAWVEDLESKWEVMRMQIKYAELLAQQEG